MTSRDDDDLSPEARAAQARAAEIDDDEDLQENPVVVVERVMALGHDPEGQTARVAVETPQGTVELQLDAAGVDAIAGSILSLRRNMQQAAARAGKPRGQSLYPVESFAIGDVQGVSGIVLTLNYRRPEEQMFVITDLAFGAKLASELLRKCSDAARGRVLDAAGRPILGSPRRLT